MIMDLHERICRYLASVPPAVSGAGGHNQTFSLACALVNGFGLEAGQALQYLTDWNVRCQPPWEEKDLVHKVESALAATHAKPMGHLKGDGKFTKDDYRSVSFPGVEKPAVVFDPATSIEIFLKGFKCSESDLWEASPVKPADDFRDDGCLVVQHLFKVGEIVNYVTDFTTNKEKAIPAGYGRSVERNELLDLWSLGMPESEAGGWMRMNPMSGAGIGDKDVTNHRHILLEFDSIPLDLQISLFARIPLPISCILTSGGKSVHAWVMSDSMDLTSYRDDSAMLLKMLARFGVDTKNKNPSRLSRLPGVVRRSGASGDGRQRLLYLNPNPQQRAIL
jgi:hypothetical protein